MARIRTIKPDFWTDEKIVELSPLARLLFIGLWNFADDEGRMPYSATRIKLQILPADSADISALLGEIRGKLLIDVYVVDGQEYLQVAHFVKHQKIDKRTPSKYPPPSGVPSESPRLPPTEVEVEVEVEGNGIKKHMSGNPDAPKLNGHRPEREVLSYLNEKAGKAYRPVKANIQLISARLKEGATPEDLRAVIDRKCAQWLTDEKMCGYLRPETLFGATKFAQYAGDSHQVSADPILARLRERYGPDVHMADDRSRYTNGNRSWGLDGSGGAAI